MVGNQRETAPGLFCHFSSVILPVPCGGAAVIGVLVAQLRKKGVVPIEIEETQETKGTRERLRKKI